MPGTGLPRLDLGRPPLQAGAAEAACRHAAASAKYGGDEYCLGTRVSHSGLPPAAGARMPPTVGRNGSPAGGCHILIEAVGALLQDQHGLHNLAVPEQLYAHLVPHGF